MRESLEHSSSFAIGYLHHQRRKSWWHRVGSRRVAQSSLTLMNMRADPGPLLPTRPVREQKSGLPFPLRDPMVPNTPDKSQLFSSLLRVRGSNMGLRHVNWCNRPLRSAWLLRCYHAEHAKALQRFSSGVSRQSTSNRKLIVSILEHFCKYFRWSDTFCNELVILFYR